MKSAISKIFNGVINGLFLIASLFFLNSCGHNTNTAASGSEANDKSSELYINEDKAQLKSDQDRDKAFKAAFARADKLIDERLHNPPEIPLPNIEAGAGLPRPCGINFYERDNRYPAYLLCNYDVDQSSYNTTNESGWFTESLLQIRHTGAKQFPPFKWVAVIIRNRAEHNGEGTFEQCHKAGAIFNANDIFDSKNDLKESVANAQVNRHPFKLDLQQETPGKQQRWLIVEQHTATNDVSKQPSR